MGASNILILSVEQSHLNLSEFRIINQLDNQLISKQKKNPKEITKSTQEI